MSSTSPMLLACKTHRKQKEEAKKAIMPCISNDTIFDIFTRIPADFLQKKFKYQCKNWLNIISDPVFIETHLRRAKEGILHHVTVNNQIELRFMDLEGIEAKKVRRLPSFPIQTLEFQSFCNGLMLCKDLRNFGYCYVINPIKKEGISLPDYIIGLQSKGADLVFIPSSKLYKVVELWHDEKQNTYAFRIKTLGSSLSTWRLIKEIEHIFYSYRRISVNGRLYMNIDSSSEILSFDVRDESTIRLLPLPDEYNILSQLTWLTKIDSYPTWVTTTRSFDEFNVWMLKDVNQGKWTKQFTFGVPGHIRFHLSFASKVLGSLNNGEVIVIEDGDNKGFILLYYVKTRKWKVKSIDSRKNFQEQSFFIGTHVNSLVSPKSLKFGS